jgi:hypothetical protein
MNGWQRARGDISSHRGFKGKEERFRNESKNVIKELIFSFFLIIILQNIIFLMNIFETWH